MLDPGETQVLSHLSHTPPFLCAFASHHSSLEMSWTAMTLRGPSGVRRMEWIDTLGRPGRWACLMLLVWPPIYAGRRRRMHTFQPKPFLTRQKRRRKGSTYGRRVSGIPVFHSDFNHRHRRTLVPNHAVKSLYRG
ncbi:hypothetical protein CGRA01v4_14044 [Colletotrichum graminicola]|nr:hypothetical protein CGRA01v4_14044 [Colletotrichum graminicola]